MLIICSYDKYNCHECLVHKISLFSSLQQVTVTDLQDDEVEVEMMVAPVNPADINQVQG